MVDEAPFAGDTNEEPRINELPITNSTDRALRLSVRPIHFASLGPDYRVDENSYTLRPGAEWCVDAPGSDVTFEIQIGHDVIVVLVGGCDVDAVSVHNRIVGEEPVDRRLRLHSGGFGVGRRVPASCGLRAPSAPAV